MKSAGQISLSASVAVTPAATAIQCERFSSLTRLLFATVYCFRLLKIQVWSRLSKDSQEKWTHLLPFLDQIATNPGLPTSKELQVAKSYWIRTVQTVHYGDVFERDDPLVKQLGLQMDSNGLLRCHGRLEHAALLYSARYPFLLSGAHHFTTLLD